MMQHSVQAHNLPSISRHEDVDAAYNQSRYSARGVYVPQPLPREKSSSATSSIRFSTPWTPNATIRERELELAAQRAHAARQAHARRKRSKWTTPATSLVFSIQFLVDIQAHNCRRTSIRVKDISRCICKSAAYR